MLRLVSLVLVGLSLTACAASTSSGRPFIAEAGRDVITATEIVAAHVTDAYQAVSQLRPEYLRRRADRPNPLPMHVSVAVYVDEMPWGTAESLRQVPLDRVRLIRYVASMEADMRWGGRHPAGAILVVTRR